MKSFEYIRIADWIIKINQSIFFDNQFYYPQSINAFSYYCNKYEDYFFQIEALLENDNIHNMIEGNLIYQFEAGLKPFELYQKNNLDYLWVLRNNQKNIKSIYSISNDYKKISILYDSNKSNGLDTFNYLGNIFAYSILNYGGICFHGVLMEYDNKGIIISAPSGVGKSTHARMWRDQRNSLIINGDRSICRKKDSTWYAYGSPWCGSSGEYINRKVPIKAIVILERGDENKVSKISPLEGALSLISRVFAPYWDSILMNKALDYIDDIVKNIPVFKLKCKPNINSVEVLHEAIENIK